jgi:hypothetical protein
MAVALPSAHLLRPYRHDSEKIWADSGGEAIVGRFPMGILGESADSAEHIAAESAEHFSFTSRAGIVAAPHLDFRDVGWKEFQQEPTKHRKLTDAIHRRCDLLACGSEPHLHRDAALSKPTQNVPRVVPVRHHVRLNQSENLVGIVDDHLSIRTFTVAAAIGSHG